MNAPFLVDQRIDPRLVFLARAAARFELVEAGEMDLDTAFGDLVADLECDCTREYFHELSVESHFHE